MDDLSLDLIRDIPRNGPTDPIEYYRRPWVGALFRRRINLGLRLLPTGRFNRALEIGYGSGGLLSVLSRSVDDLHGIDLDADPAIVARVLRARHCSAALRQGSVYDLPYPDNHFDLAVCFSVFEHLHDYPRALAETRRVLAPGGLFLLGMPAVNPVMTRLFQAIGHNTIDDIHVTTPAMIRQALFQAGFTLRADAYLDFPAPRPLGLRLYHNWLLAK